MSSWKNLIKQRTYRERAQPAARKQLGLLEKHKDKGSVIAKPPKLQGAFVVVHFVGPVTYVASGFLDKNRDAVPEDAMALLENSTSDYVRKAFQPLSTTAEVTSTKKRKGFAGVATKFRAQLESLLGTMTLCDLHFVRAAALRA